MANTKAIMTALYGDGSSVSSYTPTLREKGVDWLARNWYGDTREGVDKAYKLSNVLETVTPYGMATMGYDAGRALGGGQPVQGAMMAGLAMAPLPAAAEKKAAQGIRAFHGSPHSFDKFSLDKIGAGEGAQAYGHGLYFADNEAVAKSYREGLSIQQGQVKFPRFAGMDLPVYANTAALNGDEKTATAANMFKDFLKSQPVGGSRGIHALNFGETNVKNQLGAFKEQILSQKAQSGDEFASYYDDALEGVKTLEKYADIEQPRAGSMYEVNIKANPDDFLDWDKPLSEQGPKAKAAADKIFDPGWNDGSWSPTGESLIGKVDQRKRAEILKEAGIPGVKYLDAGSRGAGDGSRNYVVFDEKLIEIVKKYGIAGASAMLGMDVLANMDEAQASQLKKAENMGNIQKSLLSGGW